MGIMRKDIKHGDDVIPQREKTGNAGALSRLNPYPAYKDSGVEWLGEIPAHWEIIRLKQASRIQGGFAFSTDSFRNEGIPVVRMNNIRRGVLDLDDVVRIPEHKGKDAFALNEGDIIYGLSGSIGATGSLGNYAVVRKGDTPAQLNQRVARFRPVIDRITEKFLVGSLQTSAFYEQVLSYTTGTAQFNVSTNDIGNVVLALPPIKEQRAIDAFLDRETEPIDALVAKKERLIELLQEKRTALISDAVTKGLDPDVPLKDSGVEWLGEIPAHWEVKRLKRLAFMQAGTAITGDDIGAEGDYQVFGGNGVRGYTSSFTHEGEFPLIGRQGALCGCVNFATGKFWASEHAVVLKPNAGVNPNWLAQLLQVMSLNQYSQSAAQPGLSVETIGSIAVPVALKDEQRVISTFLDRETAKIDALEAKVREAIDRLKELRTALISAAVTGKIDVREAAA